MRTEDQTFTGCSVTVKSVKMGRVYLHRVRVWDSTGTQLVAMRVWSDTPYTHGLLMNMQPTVAPKSNITLASALDALETYGEALDKLEAAQAKEEPQHD